MLLSNGFDSMFRVFGIIGGIIFAAVIAVIIYIAVKAIRTKQKNDASPRLTVDARIVSKRTEVTTHQMPNAGDPTGAHGYMTSTTTEYYATFQVESGDRMELNVPYNEYGMLAEGDRGRLSFQGTRFLSFERC